MYMIHDLMCYSAVVLQDIEVFRAGSFRDSRGYWEELFEVLSRDIGKLCAVVFGNDEGVTVGEWIDAVNCEYLHLGMEVAVLGVLEEGQCLV